MTAPSSYTTCRDVTSLGDWTLVGCTVAPGFDFAAFELAPPGWKPGCQQAS
jgi:predicted cupin superfamily sugar epimerase